MTNKQRNRYLIRALAALIIVWFYYQNQVSPVQAPPTEAPSPAPASISAVLGSKTETALVSRVIDGDTIVLANNEHVRYIGMNASELKTHDCYSQEAKIANEKLVLGKQITLVKDISNRDKYGRLLRYIYIDGQFVNLVLVQQGYAKAVTYKPDVAHQSDFAAAQKSAQSQHLGLWAACQ